MKEAIKEYNYTYEIRLVEKGYTVFCPDARGFGERREKREAVGPETSQSRIGCVGLSGGDYSACGCLRWRIGLPAVS